MDDEVRKAAAGAVVEKFQDLIVQRGDALRRRSEIDREIRGIDRALFDCRAAGRLFGVDIELPEDARPAVIVPPKPAAAVAASELLHRVHRYPWASGPSRSRPQEPSLLSALDKAIGTAETPAPAPPLPNVASTTLTPGAEPSIRDLILLYLNQAGPRGEKAAVLRRRVETFLNRQIHYKTIGMSLYRLSKETPPMVRREGQTWFLIPAAAEAKDPGAATPGSLEGR
ncbi:hypothetical protein WHZ78_33460 [Bradyrhizobium symbiodeficiens]|uniref:hypothetical protein n=1 Tax=Bradyrhizobium symbiodeficiens TaxID=1404367 RepID=UPI0030D4E3E6